MDQRALGLARKLFWHIDGSIPDEPSEQVEYARRLFVELSREGGQVETLEEVRCEKTPAADLGTWSEDPWSGETYGLDAGSFHRGLEYNNGLVAEVSHAKIGVAGANADRSIEMKGTVKSAIYYDNSRSRFYSVKEMDDSEDVSGEVIAFPGPVSQTTDITKTLSTAALRFAEGQHACEYTSEIEGVLFIDGSVYPLGVLYWLMLEALGRQTPATRWDKPREIVKNYIDLVDIQYEKNLPVVGIVKTSTTSQILDALDTKIKRHDLTDENGDAFEIPWRRDHQFISKVLDDNDLNYLSYTSWFVHEETVIDNRSFETFSTVADYLDHGDPADYRRAFFYVRLPKTGGVFRVEAPLLMLEGDRQREAVKRKALKEIARRGDVPQAIARADRLARISRDNRDVIGKQITRAETYYDYNDDGRFKDIEDPNEVDQ